MSAIKSDRNEMLPQSRTWIKEPSFYHRQYDHDIVKPERPRTTFDQCKRVGLVALPFISFCKPLGKSLSLVTDGLRAVSSLSLLVNGVQAGDGSQIASGMLNSAISAASIAGTIFANPLGLLITTGHDLALNTTYLVQALSGQDYKKAGEMCAQIVASSLYLGMFFTGSIQLSILATSTQILIGLYRSADDFKNGNYLESGGHLLMSAIRVNQLSPQINAFCLKWQVPSPQIRPPQERKIQEIHNSTPILKTSQNVVFSKGISTIPNNLCQTIQAEQAGSIDSLNLTSSVVHAHKVGYNNVNGCVAHVAHYPQNIGIVTVINDPNGILVNGSQAILQNGTVINYTITYTTEIVNGVKYVKHIYPSGVMVYSTDNSQFVVY